MLNLAVDHLDCVRAEEIADINLCENRLLPVDTILAAWDQTLDGLAKVHSIWSQHAGDTSPDLWPKEIDKYRRKVSAFRSYTRVLLQRCSNATKLLEKLLDLKNQSVTERHSAHMMALTTNTVDDSATVRVITAITLVYLSCTAVGVSSHPLL
jgi:hypothetical protein